MPGSKNYSSFKGMEWLNYLIGNEIEELRNFNSEQNKKKTNEFVWPLFSFITAFTIALYKNSIIANLVDIPVILGIYLGTYFIIYKIFLKPIFQKVESWYNKFKGVAIEVENKDLERTVDIFNFNICNQVLLSHSFIEKVKDIKTEEENKPLIDYYRMEALNYLVSPIDEIQMIVNVDETFLKVVDTGKNSSVIKKNIKLYRILNVLELIDEIIKYLEDNKINNECFNIDIINIKSRFASIIKKLSDYNI